MWVTKEQIEESLNVLWDGKTFHREQFYTNCAGYAFGVKGWYMPAKNMKEYLDSFAHIDGHGRWRELERKFVKRILREFSGWTLANKCQLIEGNEYVAFRIRRVSFFCDFHFMKFDGTKWTQKYGHQEVSPEWFKLEDIFEPEAWGEYDGKLYVFKRKTA